MEKKNYDKKTREQIWFRMLLIRWALPEGLSKKEVNEHVLKKLLTSGMIPIRPNGLPVDRGFFSSGLAMMEGTRRKGDGFHEISDSAKFVVASMDAGDSFETFLRKQAERKSERASRAYKPKPKDDLRSQIRLLLMDEASTNLDKVVAIADLIG